MGLGHTFVHPRVDPIRIPYVNESIGDIEVIGGKRYSKWLAMPKLTDSSLYLRDFLIYITAMALVKYGFGAIMFEQGFNHPDASFAAMYGFILVLMASYGMIVFLLIRRGLRRLYAHHGDWLKEHPDFQGTPAFLVVEDRTGLGTADRGLVSFADGQLVFQGKLCSCRLNSADEIRSPERYTLKFKYPSQIGYRTCRIVAGGFDANGKVKKKVAFERMSADLEAWRNAQPSDEPVYPPLRKPLLVFSPRFFSLHAPLALLAAYGIGVGSYGVMVLYLHFRFHYWLGNHTLGELGTEIAIVGACYLACVAIGGWIRSRKRQFNLQIDGLVGNKQLRSY